MLRVVDIRSKKAMVMVQTFMYVTVGIVSIVNYKVNPGQPTNASCVVRTMDPKKALNSVQMSLGRKPVSNIYCFYY